MEEKIYTPEVITENALPSDDTTVSSTSSSETTTSDISTPTTIKETAVPSKRVATELISTVLDTKRQKIQGEFQFTPSGAIKIGDYKEGISGEVLISPNGIITKDIHGNVTIGLDALLGDAVFAGRIQAGTVITGAVAVGDGNILIDGATRKMLFYDANGIPSIVIGLVS